MERDDARSRILSPGCPPLNGRLGSFGQPYGHPDAHHRHDDSQTPSGHSDQTLNWSLSSPPSRTIEFAPLLHSTDCDNDKHSRVGSAPRQIEVRHG